jgi:hypothetical protein
VGITQVTRTVTSFGSSTPVAADLAIQTDLATLARFSSVVDAQLLVSEVSTFDRSALRRGIDKPGASSTGLLPGGTTTTVSSNVTYSTNGQNIADTLFNCRVSVTAKDVTFTNCKIRGDNSANALVTATNVNVERLTFIDCELDPQFARNDTNAFNGHDATFLRCNIHHTIDLAQIHNETLYTSFGEGWPTGMVFDMCWLHDLAWWTAATGGVVHPTDTETHNDIIQQFGGDGTQILGCHIDASFARQYAHWQVTNPNVEPYTTIPLGSLSDGGPFQTIPDRGTGNKATGRYNWDDDAGLMINKTTNNGSCTGYIFDDNWCYGGNFFTNGGGNPWSSGLHLGFFRRNKFGRDQGNQGSGTGNGHTLDFGGTWSGHVVAPTTGVDANVYEDDGSPITVRP